MPNRKNSIIILAFITICVILFVWNIEKDNNGNKMQTYSDKDFNFSVEFPNNWSSNFMERWGSSSTQEASPDGGIDIYVEGNKDDWISVYGQSGHISILQPFSDNTKFVTKYGNKGILYSRITDNRKEMHLIFDEGFHAAYINVSSSCYKKNEKKIIALLKSINVQAFSDK